MVERPAGADWAGARIGRPIHRLFHRFAAVRPKSVRVHPAWKAQKPEISSFLDFCLGHATLAQLVEHTLGKGEVVGSSPMGGFV